MKYAILRTKKLKTIQQITIAGMHNDRTLKVLNADKTKLNILLAGSAHPSIQYQKIIEKLKIKERSNGVKAIELVLTFSPEAKEKIDIDKWASANILWLSNEFGRAAILNAQLHLDETTPHIHAIIIPAKRKKNVWCLCCRDFLGGASKLSALQDRYAIAMQEFGLKRGIKRSDATHQQIKEFYGTLKEPEASPPIFTPPKAGFWAYRGNQLALDKLKTYTSNLFTTITKIRVRQTILKAAYLKERSIHLKLSEQLYKSEKDRINLEKQLIESLSREKNPQGKLQLYEEVPITPHEARLILSRIEAPQKNEPKLSYHMKKIYPQPKI